MLSHSCCRSGGMADALDSKSGASDGMRVRPPPSAPFSFPPKQDGKMRKHFSRVKDCVLVAVQRRDAGRAQHETLFHTSYT